MAQGHTFLRLCLMAHSGSIGKGTFGTVHVTPCLRITLDRTDQAVLATAARLDQRPRWSGRLIANAPLRSCPSLPVVASLIHAQSVRHDSENFFFSARMFNTASPPRGSGVGPCRSQHHRQAERLCDQDSEDQQKWRHETHPAVIWHPTDGERTN